MAVESAMRQRSPLLAVAVVGTALLAVAGWSLSNQGASSVALSQEGVFTPGLEVKMVPRQQQLFQSKAQVAMGSGGGKHGLWPMPPHPPPTWTRGGNTYVYDNIYGIGQRPTTGVWASGGTYPKGEEEQGETPAEQEEEVEQEREEPRPVAPGPPPRQEPRRFGGASPPEPGEMGMPPSAPAQEEEPAAQEEEEEPEQEEEEEKPGEEEEEEPEQEEEEEPEEEEEEPEQQEEEPEEEEECGEEPCQQGHVLVNMPAQQPYQQVVQQVPVPYPAAASQQLPMEWAAEDAAEHAYNLAQWRVKILKAKMDQAKLRKQLMHLSMGGSADEDDSSSGGGGGGGGTSKAELRAIKGSLLTLAQETTAAIRQLKDQMQAMRGAMCCSEKAGPTEQLSQLPADQRALAADKAQKAQEVKELKDRMDKQLDGLLKKVTRLIQNKRRS